jgi:hypothetical protein
MSIVLLLLFVIIVSSLELLIVFNNNLTLSFVTSCKGEFKYESSWTGETNIK